jgi:hypothetical protein
MSRPPLTLLIHDDDRHGVAIYASTVSAAIVAADASFRMRTMHDVANTDAGRLHVHFTDRLWGSTPESAADAFEALAARSEMSVTLHDLPQPSDGERNLARRGDCYRRVVEASCRVVVNSRHEARLLAEWSSQSRTVDAVIPLPAYPPVSLARPKRTVQAVGIIGFFYPGKGHDEVLEALRTDPGTFALVNLGAVSAGHENEFRVLEAEGLAHGIEVSKTGWLDEHDLLQRAAEVAIPVAAHRHVSASGSINTWLSAGRRPLVPDTRYTKEMSALRPGTLTVYQEGGLPAAIDRAIAHPESTWLDARVSLRPTFQDTVAAYAAFFAEEA